MITKQVDLVIDEAGLPKVKILRSFDKLSVDGPERIVKFCIENLGLDELLEERVFVFVQRGDSCIGFSEMSHGSMNAALVNMGDLARRVLLLGGDSFIVVHNHPAKTIEPSKEDTKTFHKIKELAAILDAKFLDFIIVGDGFYSAKYVGEL